MQLCFARGVKIAGMRKSRSADRGLDVAGVGLLAAALAATLTIAVPHARADWAAQERVSDSGDLHLSKKFKGSLPITELTEDQAILHALNRLGYGPRPGDVERIRQMGLEKWIDPQLHPDSIDDSALDQRLAKYSDHLTKSSSEVPGRIPAARPGRQDSEA